MLFHFKQPLPKAASETSKSAGMDDEASESLLTTESRQPTAVVGEGIPAQQKPMGQESLVEKRVSCVKPFFRQSLSFVKYTLPKTLAAERSPVKDRRRSSLEMRIWLETISRLPLERKGAVLPCHSRQRKPVRQGR